MTQPSKGAEAHPAILCALLILASRGASEDTVVFFPSDHFVSDDTAVAGQVEEALEGIVGRPDLVTLHGIAPDRAEPGYGWIEPGKPVAGAAGNVRRVRRFWERPATAAAERLRANGWLWNSFVMVGRVSTLLALVRLTVPDLHRSFAEIKHTLVQGRPPDLPTVEPIPKLISA